MESSAPTDMDTGFTPVNVEKAPRITWETRRQMSWILLGSILVSTVLAGLIGIAFDLTDKQLDFVESVYFYHIAFASTVICTYFGATVLPFIGAGRK